VAAARCAVIPLGTDLLARRFTSPIKVFEYMAAGTPIVAADLPTIREVLTHEKSALLYQPGNAGSLAEQIRRVLADNTLAQSLSNAAAAELVKYTWDERARQIIEFATRLRGAEA
jgi:glycosyltransferase involved in cell wall biosynthesis